MYILLTDETNMKSSGDSEFFIYGGIFFPVAELTPLNARIRAIRREMGYRPDDVLKFDTNARPPHVDRTAATTAKSMVLEACSEHGVRFIAHIVLHSIAANQPQDQRVAWAADYVIARFNKFLTFEAHSTGICIVDNLPVSAPWRYLTDKYTHGLTLHTGTKVALDKIELFAATAIGASHANSAMDIVLGSFRYCVNRPKSEDVARQLFAKVTPMMWCRVEDGVHHVGDYGLVVRPPITDIRREDYRQKYTDLIQRLQALLDTEDAVNDQ